MITYLITGGAGFIGSNFVHFLLKKRDDIRVINVDKLTYAGNLKNLSELEADTRHVFIKVDITNVAQMEELFKAYDPDYVVNFAAESHVDRSILNPLVFVDTNVAGTASLLDICRKSWLLDNRSHKFLQVSTDEVYGSLSLEDPEVFFIESTPLNPHSPYSASKASADMLVQAYGDTYQLPVNITRCSNNYGPYQFPEKLIPLMINNALSYEILPVYGDGLNVRDWLYVEDHCRAIDLVLHEGRPGEVYNVGGHNEYSNIEIVETILAYLNKHKDARITEELISYVEDRKGHDRRYGIDASKIKGELGWTTEMTFEKGLEKTIQWYLSNQNWIKDIVSGDYERYYEEVYGDRL